ncbi:MATE family efflux transporter [Maricurvus nonylphenolicus]|uniref:MATE family efflux transporter n=1 Tax=Maricurvus nonylphenolicus TaxID=1008307 RepID=UPI0036F26153
MSSSNDRVSVWSIAGPSILVFLLSTLAGVAIIKIVAGLGTSAVVATTAGQRVHFIQLALLMGMGAATTALISRAWGGNNLSLAVDTMKLSIKFGLGICLLVTALAMIGAGPIASFFQLTGESRELAISYIRWMFLFAPFQGLVMMMSTASRAAGDAKAPLYIGIVSNVISVIGAYMLAYGVAGLPAMGVQGAAIGWGVAYLISAIVYFSRWYLGHLKLPFKVDEGGEKAKTKQFINISMPATVEQLIMQGAMLVFIGFVAQYGAEAFAAYGVGINIMSVAAVIGLGFSIAASANVGMSLGAGKPEQALEASMEALKLAVTIMALVGLGFGVFAEDISEFMVDDSRVVEISTLFLRILAFLLPILGIDFVLSGAMRGAGDTRYPLIAGIMTSLGVRLPLAALCIWLDLPVWCIFSVFLFDQLMKCLLLTRRYRQKRWLTVFS